MDFKICEIEAKKIIGKRLMNSFNNNQTFRLWNSFMKEKYLIQNQLNNHLLSIEIYPNNFFNLFNPNTNFEKWAAVEVNNFDEVPKEFEKLLIPSGLYAVFVHKGKAVDGPKTFNYIFNTWLPQSGYMIDNRPHFELMTEKYKQDSDDSEEELFIPIKQ